MLCCKNQATQTPRLRLTNVSHEDDPNPVINFQSGRRANVPARRPMKTSRQRKPALIARMAHRKPHSPNLTNIPVTFLNQRQNKGHAKSSVLIDSGATNNFVSSRFVRSKRIKTKRLSEPIRLPNIDGSENQDGHIQSYVDLTLRIRKQPERVRFHVTNTGQDDLILALTGLKRTTL